MRLVHLFSVASVCAAFAACDAPEVASADERDRSPAPGARIVPGNAVDLDRGLDRSSTSLAGLDRAALEELRQAASELTRNCPYNRSGVAFPMVVGAVLTRHAALLGDPELAAVAPEAARHLAGMVRSVHTWTALYDTLRVAELPEPQEGDYLWGGALMQAQDLRGPDDALAGLSLSLDSVQDLVDACDPQTLARIELAQAALEAGFPGGWPLQVELLALGRSVEQVMDEARLRATTAPPELQAAFAWLDRDMLTLHGLIRQFVAQRS